MAIDYINSFYLFELKFNKGTKYQDADPGLFKQWFYLPPFYVDKISTEGLLEYNRGFWHLINPYTLTEEISDFLDLNNVYPVVKNAFGCFIVFYNDGFYYLNLHVRNFGLLSNDLGIILNSTLPDDYALRDMFFMDYFEGALMNLGQVNHDEIYAFNPALALGGELKAESLIKVKAKEHIAFLSQI